MDRMDLAIQILRSLQRDICGEYEYDCKVFNFDKIMTIITIDQYEHYNQLIMQADPAKLTEKLFG